MMRLKAKHIEREYSDSDGYWIELKRGFKSGEDPIGVVHGIHEGSKAEAWRVDVLACDCDDCKE